MLTRNECQSIMPVFMDWRENIPRHSIYWKIREWVYTHVKDEDSSSLYSDRGRRSVPPTRILAAIMLQLTMGLSDRKLEEASRYDDRVELVSVSVLEQASRDGRVGYTRPSFHVSQHASYIRDRSHSERRP